MLLRWQNLNDEEPGHDGHPFWHGRAWLHDTDRTFDCCFTWRHGFQSDARLMLDLSQHDRSITFSVGGPLASYWLTVEGLPRAIFDRLPFRYRRSPSPWAGGERRIGLRFFNFALWWSCWEDDHESRGDDPWWMRGRIGLDDFLERLLGKMQIHFVIESESETQVPMPEKAYPAKAKTIVQWRTYPRWPWSFAKTIRVELEIPGGIPIPGKGENAWDLEDDAIFGTSCSGALIEQGIAQVIRSVLETRRRQAKAHV